MGCTDARKTPFGDKGVCCLKMARVGVGQAFNWYGDGVKSVWIEPVEDCKLGDDNGAGD